MKAKSRAPSYAGIVPLTILMGSSAGFSQSTPVLQLEPGPHVAALAGIVALVLLGGVLIIRNRLNTPPAVDTELTSSREDFLTDREKVRKLVIENGGRMKQSAIVDSVDWSKAKVSRLLADLEEDDEITKLRLGRENLVCLRGHEPAASKSSEQSARD